MVDVIAVSGGDPGLDTFLRQMRGDDAMAPPDAGAGEGVVCDANGCVPARPDALGNVNEGAGYWWPRIVITLLALAVILTIAAMRLVAPAGMRGVWRRRSRRAVATPSLDIEEEAT
jgi:hypothetical protein